MKPRKTRELTERDIKDLLTPRERPVPPADLAERIKREIPADLPELGALTDDAEVPASLPMSGSRIWLMAASVVIAVGGGFLALRWMDRMPAPGESSSVTARFDTVAPEQTVEQPNVETQIATAEGSPVGGLSVEESAAGPLPGESSSSSEIAGARGPEALPEKIATQYAATPERPTSRENASSGLGDESAGSDDADRDGGSIARGSLGMRMATADREASLVNRGELSQQESAEAARGQAEQPEPDPEVALPEPKAKRVRLPGLIAPPASPAPPPPPPPLPPPAPARRAPVAQDGETGGLQSQSQDERARLREQQLQALGYTDDSHVNYSIEESNPRIAEMKEEARRLEAEIKKVLEAPPTVMPASTAPPSTGGTTEPNDAPYGDMFFESAGTNPFIDTEDDALSTFGLDVDTGSYTVARRYLRDGNLPPHAAVRVEEFINYFDYGDAAPEKDEFAIHAEGAPSIYGQGERYHLLRFNLSGRELQQADRRPALLTFVIDVSGSMGYENRLDLVKQALALLIDQLRSDDRLALVIYGSRGQVVLPSTGDHGAIRRAIDGLRTGGSTNAEEGLTLAYELAARHRRPGTINRVILCSDGVANVGATSAGSILDRIRREADQGIELTTVGFGMGNYNDVLMERLADTGNGRYAYVDTLDEARRIFVENLTGTLQTLAAEARVQVEFDPETVERYRLLGYENRDIADERFRDDTVDAGEIGVGHKVTALYEIKTTLPLRDTDRIARLSLRYGSIERREMVEVARTVTGADFSRRWEKASPALKLTTLVAEYAEILKRSFWAREGDLDDVFRRSQRLSAKFEGDREVADFVSLVGQAAEIWEREEKK